MHAALHQHVDFNLITLRICVITNIFGIENRNIYRATKDPQHAINQFYIQQRYVQFQLNSS